MQGRSKDPPQCASCMCSSQKPFPLVLAEACCTHAFRLSNEPYSGRGQRSLLVDGVAGGHGPLRLLGQREHEDVLVLGRPHGVVPQLLVRVGARVGALLVEVGDVGRRVLVVEEALRSCAWRRLVRCALHAGHLKMSPQCVQVPIWSIIG